jgi:hypothetical protein
VGADAEDAATKQSAAGTCASRDRYLKRDELGVIYQLCVVPGHQRGLIGASLIKAVFERSAYGCRSIAAGARRTCGELLSGESWVRADRVPGEAEEGQGRVHIFWQRRIRAGKDTTTPWWFPARRSGRDARGSIGLPDPAGVALAR